MYFVAENRVVVFVAAERELRLRFERGVEGHQYGPVGFHGEVLEVVHPV